MTLYNTDKEGVMKDMNSKAVVNTDLASFNKYKAQKAKNDELRFLRNEVARLGDEQTQLWDTIHKLHNEMEYLKTKIV